MVNCCHHLEQFQCGGDGVLLGGVVWFKPWRVTMQVRMSEYYRPMRLDQVVGQACTADLLRYVKSPVSRGFLFVGDGGCGKTSTAYALARELGAMDDWDFMEVVACDLDVQRADDVRRWLNTSPRVGCFKVLLVEELEWLHKQVVVKLKSTFEKLPSRAVVIATSNDTSGLDGAFVQRFQQYRFESARGGQFATACCGPRGPLMRAWYEQVGPDCQPPRGWQAWGYEGGNGATFSLRVAYDRLEQSVLRVKSEGTVVA